MNGIDLIHFTKCFGVKNCYGILKWDIQKYSYRFTVKNTVYVKKKNTVKSTFVIKYWYHNKHNFYVLYVIKYRKFGLTEYAW